MILVILGKEFNIVGDWSVSLTCQERGIIIYSILGIVVIRYHCLLTQVMGDMSNVSDLYINSC